MSTEPTYDFDWLNSDEPVLDDYAETIARSEGLAAYKTIFQYGKKAGESLYTHVLNGILVLETLRPLLALTDEEARTLFLAFTVHDINKTHPESRQAFKDIATPENIAAEVERMEADAFFPEWRDYLEDITTLVRGHGGHTDVGGARLIPGRAGKYMLGRHRVDALVKLMKAADIIDLSHTLDEHTHKATFLSHLNAFLADSGLDAQYVFFTHQLVEQRGILTNVFHNAVITYLSEAYGMMPLLLYPDGVAYLVMKGEVPTPGEADIGRMAGRAAESLNEIITEDFAEFIKPGPQGIKVNAKCLRLGISFPRILRVINGHIQRKERISEGLDEKARRYAQDKFERSRQAEPSAADAVQQAIDAPESLVVESVDDFRRAELVRTYYIFLNKHFKKAVGDSWQHIYGLLDIPQERRAFYAYFDPLFQRAYVLGRDLSLSWDEVYRRIEEDGSRLVAQNKVKDAKAALFEQYFARYLVFGIEGVPQVRFGDGLAHYVAGQHKQCVYCGGPFETAKWMTADVRSDITVQVFSNRLRGGPGEPKKYICAVCQTQFLLEKLNYPEVRGEQTLYLHLYPYSFFTTPFIAGLKQSVQQMRETDAALKALNMDAADAINQGRDKPHFRGRTKKDKPQPYGVYVPRFAKTTGNLLILPINPGGGNDTKRFLFALWNALVLQRYFGVKVLLSNAPVAPLGKEHIADLYVDNIPLACEGLLPDNDYARYADGSQAPGTLVALWEAVRHLFALRPLVSTLSDDRTPALVRALAGSPLMIFYETEKSIERRLKEARWLNSELRKAFTHVEALALSKGGLWMAQLSEELRKLAGIARSNWIKGRTFKKSSLLFPVAEVFDKLKLAGRSADLEALRAATVQDIFDHLDRIAEAQYKPGKTKREAIKAFVDGWYDGVLAGVYAGNLRRLLSDEKLVRSAYLFYFSEAGSADQADGESESDEA